jgi:DNA-directed RNA polymerase specialized sigma24 family protein
MTEYQRPMLVDTTRYQQSEAILKAMSTRDEYFAQDKPEDPLVLIVDALLATLPADERAVVEMCIMSGISQHEAARTLGYINKDGKEDHKMVKRRLVWAIRKLQDTLTSPSFATAIAGHKMPVEQPAAAIKERLSSIIQSLEVGEDDE